MYLKSVSDQNFILCGLGSKCDQAFSNYQTSQLDSMYSYVCLFLFYNHCSFLFYSSQYKYRQGKKQIQREAA